MISTNPREDKAIKVTAGAVVLLMAVLTSARACQVFRHSGRGPICAAMEAFRLKAIAVLGREPQPPESGCPR